MYRLVVRIYDEEKGLVCSRFWHMCLVSDCTSQGIFTEVSKAFEKDGIPWCNVIGLSLDNASVNMGKHNGLFRKFEAKKDDLEGKHYFKNSVNFVIRNIVEF